MADIQRRIKRNWFPPRDFASRQTVVNFKIARDGTVFAIKVDKTSGSASEDKAAINAVQDASPFTITRPYLDYMPIEIQFTFDNNVFGRTTAAKLAKDDLESAPPDEQAMLKLRRHDFSMQSALYEYAQSFEKFGKFESALRLYEKLLYLEKFEPEKNQAEIASLNRSIELVKQLIEASTTTAPDRLEPLVLDCLERLETDSTLSHSTSTAIRKRLAHLVFQRKADAVRIAEAVSKTVSLSLFTKQMFIQTLHDDATIDFYSARNATTLGQLNVTFKKKLSELEESNRICDAAFKFERQGNLISALENYSKASALRAELFGENDGDTLAIKGDIARVLLKQGKVKESRVLYEDTVSAFKKSGDLDYRYTRFLESYGDALSQAKVEPLASQVYSQAVEAWKNSKKN
jgi:TonB family protein